MSYFNCFLNCLSSEKTANGEKVKINKNNVKEDKEVCVKDLESKKLVKEIIVADDNNSFILKDYKVCGLLGNGAQGEVRICKNKDNKKFAVKILSKKRTLFRKRNNENEKLDKRIQKEINIMITLDHPNIVHLIEVIESSTYNKIFLIMELINGGPIMSDKLKNQKPLEESKVKDLFRQLVKGLEYLHYHDIIHRDIKPSNLLVTNSGLLKISDFGISFLCRNEEIILAKQKSLKIQKINQLNKNYEKLFEQQYNEQKELNEKVLFSSETKNVLKKIENDEKKYNLGKLYPPTPKVISNKLNHIDENNKLSHVSGTSAFLPPEAFSETHVYNGVVADVWAAGVTLYLLLFGRVPFLGETQVQIAEYVCTKELEFPNVVKVDNENENEGQISLNIEISKESKELLQLMLMKDITKRINTTESVKDHIWVKDGWKRDEEISKTTNKSTLTTI